MRNKYTEMTSMTATTIDLSNVMDLEDVRLQEVNSVETYTIELERARQLIYGHIRRCKAWDEIPPRWQREHRKEFGKLNEFLEQLTGEN